LAAAKAALAKALPKDDSFVEIDEGKLTKSMPHLPTGSIIIDYIIGGKPNRYGVRPCPGLPRGRIVNLYGQESSGKCLPADTYIRTEKGLQTVGEILQEQGISVVTDNDTTPVEIPLFNRYGELENTTHITRNGKRPLLNVQTFSGASVRSTYNHPHLVMNDRGNWVWKKAQYLVPGDVLVSLRGTQKLGSVDRSEDEAYLLGLILADGHMTDTRISITNDDPDIKSFIETKAPELLNIPIHKYANGDSPNSFGYHFNSKLGCANFFERNGISAVNSPQKYLGPVLRCLTYTGMRELLRGYVDCECSVDEEKSLIEVVSASRQLLTEIKLVLQSYFGIVALVRDKKVADYPDNQYWRMTLSGTEARQYVNLIGTRSVKRSAEFESLAQASCEGGSTNFDSVPSCGLLIRDLYDSQETQRSHNAVCNDYMGSTPKARLTRPRLSQIINLLGSSDNSIALRLKEIQKADYFYDEIVTVDENEPEATFDFAMRDTHSFIANGFVTHNTTMALMTAVTTCQAGGSVCYVDWEHAIDMSYAASLGIPTDTGQFELVQPETLEKGLSIIWTMAKAGVDLIIIDSVGAGVPEEAMAQSIGDKGKMTRMGLVAAKWAKFLPELKAIIARNHSCIIGISQLRKKIATGPGAGHGPDTQAQGGEAWKFFSEVRIMLRRVSVEKGKEYNALTHKTEEVAVGQVVRIKIDKCKVSSAQGKEGEFYIKFGDGIDDIRSVIDIAANHGLVKKAGAWYTWTRNNGDTVKGCGIDGFKQQMASAEGGWQELYRATVSSMSALPEIKEVAETETGEDLSDLTDMPIMLDPVAAEDSEEDSE
jgi:recombination protein RecA